MTDDAWAGFSLKDDEVDFLSAALLSLIAQKPRAICR